jgi:ABC-type xylose transport system permease subunit
MRVISKIKETGRIVFAEGINMEGIILLGTRRVRLVFFVNYGMILSLSK